MNFSHVAFFLHALAPQFNFPQGPAIELIMLRWLHFIFGIIWIGLLYFFNLVGFPTMKQLDAAVRGKVFPVLMSRAMSWFRWSALITVVVGLRYYFTILSADAHNSGNSGADAALVRMVAAGVARGLRADLSVSVTGQGAA